jgi:Secretion system C-terminal sorting domain
MRTIMLALAIICYGQNLGAQTLERSVLGVAGKRELAPNISLEWTLGELAVSHYTKTAGELNEGFHQPHLSVVPEAPGTNDQRFRIFPNPTRSELFIQVQLHKQERIRLLLIDQLGRRVLPERVAEHTVDEQLDLQNLPAGIYHLLITNAKGKPLHQAKILKQ